MKGTLVAALTAMTLFLTETPAALDFWGIVDKYGFPTAGLIVSVAFIWNRQKKADDERNGLILQNNLLTQDLIKAVKEGNACKYKT